MFSRPLPSQLRGLQGETDHFGCQRFVPELIVSQMHLDLIMLRTGTHLFQSHGRTLGLLLISYGQCYLSTTVKRPFFNVAEHTTPSSLDIVYILLKLADSQPLLPDHD